MISMPIRPRKSPKAAIIKALGMDPPARKVRMINPRSIRLKYSGGPNCRAISARGGARNINPMMERVPAMKGPKGGNPQGRAGPSLAGHLVAVQAGNHRGGLSWDVNQDGSGGSAVHGPIIDPGQHDDRRNRGNMKGAGQEQGHGGHRAQPGQNPDQRADQDPDETEEKVHRLQGHLKAQDHIGRKIHFSEPENSFGKLGLEPELERSK